MSLSMGGGPIFAVHWHFAPPPIYCALRFCPLFRALKFCPSPNYEKGQIWEDNVVFKTVDTLGHQGRI